MRCLGLFLACSLLSAGQEVPVSAVERLQQDALAYVETQAAGLPGAYVFHVLKPPVLPRSTGDLRFEPSHVSKRELAGHFFASFNVSLDGRSLGMVRVDMEGEWKGKLLRTRVSLPRKAVPEVEQLESFAFEGTPPAGALGEFPAGYRLRAAMPPGHIVTQSELEPIPVILAGDQVRLAFVSGDLTIALETLARSNGALGEKVRLELPTTHKPILATVTGPGEAQAQWGGRNSAGENRPKDIP